MEVVKGQIHETLCNVFLATNLIYHGVPNNDKILLFARGRGGFIFSTGFNEQHAIGNNSRRAWYVTMSQFTQLLVITHKMCAFCTVILQTFRK